MDTIKPSVVIASGDLTDARGKDFFISQQYDGEWKIYHDILTEANVKEKTIWLDLRGNHGLYRNQRECYFSTHIIITKRVNFHYRQF